MVSPGVEILFKLYIYIHRLMCIIVFLVVDNMTFSDIFTIVLLSFSD